MIITVSQLNNYLKGVVDMDGVLSSISVSGEVTNVKAAHNCLYFTLKDDTAQIDCFSYESTVASLPHGMQVVASGTVNYLTKFGKVSFFVKSVRVTDKIGEQHLKLLALQRQLQKEGLFDDSRKKTVPSSCGKIGVVSSKSGAVIKDICDVVSRRQPYSDVVLYPVHVQGDKAASEIVCGIEYFSDSDVDVVILARGGGSNEDLAVFNSEEVVRAVAACKKPIVSAIGHGVDYTLSDLAADKRAVTPSEAAELVTTNVADKFRTIFTMLQSVQANLRARVDSYQNTLQTTCLRISRQIEGRVLRIRGFVLRKLSLNAASLDKRIATKYGETEKYLEIIDANNPAKVLKKGYALIEKDGKALTSTSQFVVGTNVRANLSDGEVDLSVVNVRIRGAK